MSLRENMASFFRAFAEKNELSMAKIQVKADISRNSLYAYSRGEGNPTISTVEYIAGNLNVDPADIMLGIYDPDSQEISVLLLNTVRDLSKLPQADQQKFIRLFLMEMGKLWDKE